MHRTGCREHERIWRVGIDWAYAGDERTDSVDLLAARVAEVVKAEVNRFFEWDKEMEE
ncbi:MAG: hypothetical protein U9R02_04235 [Thermodesulfobacteriota bacterium]|nr:hypothetical protein [Thermodesulfobacteriota bacterium]